MALEIKYTKRMRQDIKRAAKQGKDMTKLEYVLDTLAAEKTLAPKYKDHKLSGNKAKFRECRI
jgi:mRNA interferase YafQ